MNIPPKAHEVVQEVLEIFRRCDGNVELCAEPIQRYADAETKDWRKIAEELAKALAQLNADARNEIPEYQEPYEVREALARYEAKVKEGK